MLSLTLPVSIMKEHPEDFLPKSRAPEYFPVLPKNRSMALSNFGDTLRSLHWPQLKHSEEFPLV